MSLQSLLPEILSNPERDELRRTLTGALDKLLPPDRIREVDESGAFPHDLWSNLADLGVHGLGVPEHRGGSGGGLAEALIVTIELATTTTVARRRLDPRADGEPAAARARHPRAARPLVAETSSDGTGIIAFGFSEPDGGTDVPRRSHPSRAQHQRLAGQRTKAVDLHGG